MAKRSLFKGFFLSRLFGIPKYMLQAIVKSKLLIVTELP